jgi:hypothetical protein
MWNRPPLFGGCEPPLDLLTHVKVVLDILERRIVGQVLKELAYFVLGSLQFDLLNFTLPRLKATRPIGVSRLALHEPVGLSCPHLRITLALSGRGEHREPRAAGVRSSTLGHVRLQGFVELRYSGASCMVEPSAPGAVTG